VIPQAGEGEAEQERDEQHLQDLPIGKRPHEGIRDDMEHKIHRGAVLRRGGVLRNRLGIERGDVRIDPHARLDPVDHEQPDDEREG
jgi:hypothetical protein